MFRIKSDELCVNMCIVSVIIRRKIELSPTIHLVVLRFSVEYFIFMQNDWTRTKCAFSIITKKYKPFQSILLRVNISMRKFLMAHIQAPFYTKFRLNDQMFLKYPNGPSDGSKDQLRTVKSAQQ